jgi:ribosome-associated translation inhibitor RaiA
VQILFQAHHAVISDHMRNRAERTVRKLARKLKRAVDAIVRFETDGKTRVVELIFNAPGKRSIIAKGQARHYGPALAAAAERMDAQLNHLKRTPAERGRALARV